MEREELARAAGFFDGEGCVSASVIRGISLGVRISIPQIDREVLDRFRLAVGGCGSIYGPYARKSGQAMYQYNVYSVRKVDEVMGKLLPYLSSPKKEQYRRVMARHEAWYAERQSDVKDVDKSGSN